jgi:hypothetical protein
MRRFILGVALAAMTGLSPAGAIAEDQETAQRIAGALRASGQLSDFSIGVQYEEGTAWLSGRVASDEQMQTALEMCRQHPDVTQVVNQLEVKATRPAGDTAVRFSETKQDSEVQPAAHTSNMLGLRRLAPPAKSPTARKPQAKQPAQQVAAKPVAAKPVASKPVQSSVKMVAAAEVESEGNVMADPGDPLVRTQQPRFSPSASRRFADDPVVRQKSAPTPAASANRATSYQAQPAPAARQQMQPTMPQQGGQPIPAQQAGFHHRRYAPPAAYCPPGGDGGAGAGYGGPVPMGGYGAAGGPVMYDNAQLPNYAWPSYAAYPNYAAVTYPTQYSATAWPYIGPFYPYPQVPLGWRKVSLEWDDGWWFLDFHDRHCHH